MAGELGRARRPGLVQCGYPQRGDPPDVIEVAMGQEHCLTPSCSAKVSALARLPESNLKTASFGKHMCWVSLLSSAWVPRTLTSTLLLHEPPCHHCTAVRPQSDTRTSLCNSSYRVKDHGYPGSWTSATGPQIALNSPGQYVGIPKGNKGILTTQR